MVLWVTKYEYNRIERLVKSIKFDQNFMSKYVECVSKISTITPIIFYAIHGIGFHITSSNHKYKPLAIVESKAMEQ